MYRVEPGKGVTVSYEKHGNGPPLVLVHGGFSDHRSNWEFVLPFFEKQFAVYAIARRGRGETDATEGHGLEDESRDVAALIRTVSEPVFLLGHSYGAHAALLAATMVPDRVRKLVLYEAPWPHIIGKEKLESLEALARVGDWHGFSVSFFHDVLRVPMEELNTLRATALWAPIIADAKASLGDLRAVSRYDFTPDRFRDLRMPILLQIGTESPRELYVTDSLCAVHRDILIQELEAQAHEGMTAAPKSYAEAVSKFLLA